MARRNSSSAGRNIFRILAYLISLALALNIVFRVIAFVHIFGTHEGRLLTQPEVVHAYESSSLPHRKEYIPRIIHQIFHNWTDPDDETLPADWSMARQSCIDLHPGWDNRLWTTHDSRQFLAREYPWFLETYDNYRLPIQRIDALRYFLLRHFGGIYIDLDNGCKASMIPLLYYPAFVVDGGRGALSNDVLGGTPNHSYWILMTDNLISYSWNYLFPYITISYASGQWYETAIWTKYYKAKGGGRAGEAEDAVRVLVDSRIGEEMLVFWFHTRGGTWDNWDNRLFGWIGDNLVATLSIIITGVAGMVLIGMALIRVSRRIWVGDVKKKEAEVRSSVKRKS